MRLDPLYEKAMRFARNFQKKHNTLGFSNIYVIRRKDKEGNVLGEYYGMNLMTDYGMQQFFTTSTAFPKNLYIGNGDGILGVDSQTLISPIMETAATVRDGTLNYQYPLYFSTGSPNSSGLITATCRFMIAYLAYNYTDLTTPVAISEYGIGTSVNNLWTHSWVYTDAGARTTVTKNPNEELEFNVYFCMAYYDSMINDAWAEGKSIVITTMERFMNRMVETQIRRFKRNNVIQACEKTNTNTGFDNITHMITTYANLTQFTLSSGTTAATGYMDGLASWTNGFCMVERELKATTENVDAVLYPKNEISTSDDSLTYCFGDATKIPITQMNVQHSYTFNHATGAFDSEENFTGSADKWYTETTMDTQFAVPIYYTTNNTITQMYLYQNLNTSDPIIKIGGAVSTVYATDTYWDTSSWTFLSDLNNVPASERNRKYWISASNSISLNPIRQNIGYRVTQPNSLYTETFGFTDAFPIGMYESDGSKTYNLFTIDRYLYDITRNIRYEIYGSKTGFNTVRTFIQNGKVVLFTNEANIYVASYSAGTGWTTATIAGTAGITNYIGQCYISNADNMIVCKTDDGKMERIANGAIVSGSADTGIAAACAIMLTQNSYAFVRSSDPHTIQYYSDNAIAAITFSIPSTAATPTYMFGYTNNLYVTDGRTYMYHINTTNGTVTACDEYVPAYESLYRMRVSAVDGAVITYFDNYINGNYTYMLLGSNPTHMIHYPTIFVNMSRSTGWIMKLMKWNDTIVMVENCGISGGVLNTVHDMSEYIYDQTSQKIYVSGNISVWIPYGNRIIHQNQVSLMTNYIPHRVTGTTKTITTLNTTKNIRSKQWALTFTNTPSFYGLPPGTQQ